LHGHQLLQVLNLLGPIELRPDLRVDLSHLSLLGGSRLLVFVFLVSSSVFQSRLLFRLLNIFGIDVSHVVAHCHLHHLDGLGILVMPGRFGFHDPVFLCFVNPVLLGSLPDDICNNGREVTT
jgi:hypothetical protein